VRWGFGRVRRCCCRSCLRVGLYPKA